MKKLIFICLAYSLGAYAMQVSPFEVELNEVSDTKDSVLMNFKTAGLDQHVEVKVPEKLVHSPKHRDKMISGLKAEIQRINIQANNILVQARTDMRLVEFNPSVLDDIQKQIESDANESLNKLNQKLSEATNEANRKLNQLDANSHYTDALNHFNRTKGDLNYINKEIRNSNLEGNIKAEIFFREKANKLLLQLRSLLYLEELALADETPTMDNFKRFQEIKGKISKQEPKEKSEQKLDRRNCRLQCRKMNREKKEKEEKLKRERKKEEKIKFEEFKKIVADFRAAVKINKELEDFINELYIDITGEEDYEGSLKISLFSRDYNAIIKERDNLISILMPTYLQKIKDIKGEDIIKKLDKMEPMLVKIYNADRKAKGNDQEAVNSVNKNDSVNSEVMFY